MGEVFEIVKKEPKSPKAMVDLVHGILDRLYDEKISYLEISIKSDKENAVNSVSITIP